MLRTLFLALLPLALLGDARVVFFVVNHAPFRARRDGRPLLYVVPPIVLALTLLFWPLYRAIMALDDLAVVHLNFDSMGSLAVAKLGAAWLVVAAAIGAYWIFDRARVPRPPRPRRKHPLNEVYDLEVTLHEIVINDLPPAFDGYRIAFLTDPHVASFMRREHYQRVIAETMRFAPDLILLGGDYVSYARDIPLVPDAFLGDLHARDGIFAVLGNHDYWADPDAITAALTSRGVRMLANHSVILARQGQRILLGGIEERYRGRPDVDAVFARADRDLPRIALSHHPDIVDLLDGVRVDLLLCGHTHGGQINLPFFGPVLTLSKHEARFASGFQRDGGVLLYISRGLGAVPPIRIRCRPELATFVLRR